MLPVLAIVFAGIALITAFVLPIITWVPAVAAIVLAIIALVKRRKPFALGLAAVILAPIAWIIAIIVAIAMVAGSVSDALDVTTDDSGAGAAQSAEPDDDAPAEQAAGTRDNPLPLGATIKGAEWTVVVNSVTFGATDAVLAANAFNDAPPAGSEYILINYTATYTGDDANGATPAFVSVEFVTPQGNTIDGLDSIAVAPDAIDTLTTLYTGASVTGNITLAVPSDGADQGVLAVRAGLLVDKVFVAVK